MILYGSLVGSWNNLGLPVVLLRLRLGNSVYNILIGFGINKVVFGKWVGFDSRF